MNTDSRLKKMEAKTRLDDSEPAILKELDKTDPGLAEYIREIQKDACMDKGLYERVANILGKVLGPEGSDGDDSGE